MDLIFILTLLFAAEIGLYIFLYALFFFWFFVVLFSDHCCSIVIFVYFLPMCVMSHLFMYILFIYYFLLSIGLIIIVSTSKVYRLFSLTYFTRSG